MIDINSIFSLGRNKTITTKQNFSYNGPWQQLYENTVVDRWYVGDFAGVEITVMIDSGNNHREIIKALVSNSINTASITIYGRNNLGVDIASLDVIVNESYAELLISPKTTDFLGAKFIYSGNYFYSQNPLSK